MKRILVLFLLVLVFTPAAAAQVSARDIELGVDIGAMKFDSSVSDDMEALVGLRAGWFATDALALELDIRRASAPLSGEMQTVMVNAQYNFNPARTVNPYVYAGIGGASVDLNPLFGAERDDSSLAVGAGAGVRMFFSETSGWALRLQAGALAEDTFDDSATNLMFTGGISYRFRR